MIDVKDVLQVLASAFGAWCAIRVELRWLRADQKRADDRIAEHDERIRSLELGET